MDSSKDIIATNVKGFVKWFHRVKGFGFLTREDTNEDVFVHHTSIKPISINFSRLTRNRLNLMDKEKVQFDLIKSNNGLEAVNVVGKNGYLILDIIAYKREISPFGLEIINDARVSGKVKWFNVKIKYGFIHCDYNNEDVFVHSSAIIKNNPNKYKASLSEGEIVEFDILKRDDGKLEAVNVSGPNGLNVVGSRYSPDKKNIMNKNYSEQDIIGKVKWFNVKAGFGFINRNDNGQDVYVHYSSIENKNPNHRVRSLADGELVKFNIIEGTKGSEATDITALDGGTVRGSEYARLEIKDKKDTLNNASNSTKAHKFSRKQLVSPPLLPIPNQMRMNYINPRQQKIRNDGYQNNVNNHSSLYSNQYNDQNNYQSKMRKNDHLYDHQIHGSYIRNSRQMSYQYDQNDRHGPNQRNQHQQSNQVVNTSSIVIGRRVSGTVKWYNYKNGFGFVTRNDNNQDIFVHRSGLKNFQPGLNDGETVEFDVLQHENRLIAVNITGPNSILPLTKKKSSTENKVFHRRKVTNNYN